MEGSMKQKHFIVIACYALILTLLCAPIPRARAGYSEDDKALVLAHVTEDYPDWRVALLSPYGSGKWHDELARHVSVNLYRIQENMLLQKTLHVLTNPVWAGEEIQYDEEDLAPVPLTPEAAKQIEALTPDELPRVLGNWIDVDLIPGCAEFLLRENERWITLGTFPDKLIGVVEDAQGCQRLLIATWNGREYDGVLSSPAQEASIWINEIHSNGRELELMLDDGLVYVDCDGDAPAIAGVNTGWGIWIFSDGVMWDGVSYDSSNELYPGVPAFPLSLAEMDLSAVPQTNRDVVAAMDASGWACVRENGTDMRDAPDGSVIASCYARLFGQIRDEQGDWVLLQIGGEEYGGAGWFRREDVAFGQDGYSVPCGFPSYGYENSYEEHLNEVLRGLPAPLSGKHLHKAWLIGMRPDGDWLVLVDADILCTAAPDAFSQIGEPEEYYDPRYSYDWDGEGLRTLEYIEEKEGLAFLRILMAGTAFVRDTFPQHCYLETDHDSSAILIDYCMKLPDGPVDWNEVPQEAHVFITFDYLEGKWRLTNCTDALTWTAKVDNGRCTFTDYVFSGPEWEWTAQLDDDLMTFDFLELESLIDQYNQRMPDRSSVTDGKGAG